MSLNNTQLLNPGNENALPHVLLPLSQLLCLSLSPFRLRAAFFVPLILAFAYQTYTNHMGDTVASRAMSGIHWTVFLGTLCKLIWARPEHDFWRLDRMRGEATSMASLSFQKLHWATSLALNMRGIGWNYQVKGVPAHRAPQQKARFLAYQFGNWIKYYIITDLLHVFFDTYHHAEGPELASLDLWDHQSLAWSAVSAFCAGAKLYYPIQMNYTLASMISVLLGICEPKDWPPLFGSISLATTLRNFWGKYWHQLIRKVFTDTGNNVARILALPRGTNFESYFKLYLSFALSGVTHGLMTYSMPAYGTHTFSDRFSRVFTCFVLNAVLIQFEDGVIHVYKRIFPESKPGGLKTLIGYVWTTGCVWFSLQMAGTAYLRMGMTGTADVPVPIMGRLLESLNEQLSGESLVRVTDTARNFITIPTSQMAKEL